MTTWIRCALAILAFSALNAQASAQWFPIIGLPTFGQGGIAFQAGGRNLSIAGFVPLGPAYPAVVPVTPTPFGYKQVAPAFLPYGYYGLAPGFPFPGYGAINQRITVQVVAPASVVQGRRTNSRETVDLSGIDLDRESPEKIWGKKPEVAKAALPKNGEAVKMPLPPPEKKQQVIAPVKPAPAPPAPKPPEPISEGERFVKLGINAFKNGDYGVAILRFRQASECEPPGPRALFLQGHACIAARRYHDAVLLIQKGLRRRPDWPTSGFRPKVELYENKNDLWQEHRDALDNMHKADRNNADFLFLLGYLEWFGGDADAARGFFQRARALADDVRWSDAFLKVAKGK